MKVSILMFFIFLTTFECERNNKHSVKIKKNENVDYQYLVKEIYNYKIKVDSIKSNLDSVQKDTYESTEGGIIKSFYNHSSDTLRKNIVYYGEMGKREINIYKRAGKDILIEDIIVNYKEPITVVREIEIVNIIRDIYYLDNEQRLVYWIKNNKVMPRHQYKSQEKNILYSNN